MAEFREQLQKAMEAKGITQAELCKRTGITKSALSQYLSGSFKPKQKRTYLLAKALNVNEAWLIGMESADMERHDQQPSTPDFPLTNHEKEVIIAYRQQPSLQIAVDRTLGITPLEDKKEKRA